MPDPTRTYRRQAMLNTKSLLEHFQFIKQSADLIQNSVKPNRGFLLTSVCLDRRLRAVTLEITFASLRIKVLLIFKFHYTKSSDAFSDTSSVVPVQSCLYPFGLRDYSARQEEALPLQPCSLPHFPSVRSRLFRQPCCLPLLNKTSLVETRGRRPPKSGF